MTEATLPLQPGAETAERAQPQSAFMRVVKYSSLRLFALFVTVVIAVYLTIMIANMGGYVDEIKRGYIREQVALSGRFRPGVEGVDRRGAADVHKPARCPAGKGDGP